MAGVNFSGIASGLDTNLIIQSLLVNKQLRVDGISTRIDEEAAQKRALNDVKTSLNTFQGLVNKFSDDVFSNRTVTSTDQAVLTAKADGSSALAEHDIAITQLASRSVATFGQTQASATEIIGAGSINVNLAGGDSLNVSLTDPNSTLTDLRQAINDQHGDKLQASIIEVATGSFQLVVSTKETGANFDILDDSDGGGSVLNGFNGSFLGAITTEQAAKNAIFTVDGINITRATNEFDDVLEGVTLTLRGTGSSNLKVDTDLQAIVSDFQEFVKGYNDVLSQIERVTNRETGILAGDNDLKNLKSNLQGFITRFVPNSDKINIRDDSSIGFTSLSQLGFKTDSKTGDLGIDTEILTEALEDNFSEVQNLLNGNSTTSNENITLSSKIGDPFSGTVIIDSINDTASFDGGSPIALERNGNILTTPSNSLFSGFVFQANSAVSSTTLEISSGLASLLDQKLDSFTGFSGLINDRTTTIDTRTRNLEKDLERAEDRLENERNRLTVVFAKAEQSISTLQGLQASLGAQTTGFGL